jgi:hypothetical protein
MFNASQSPYLICYNPQKVIVDKYGFNVEWITTSSTAMHGSGEGHSVYIYRRRNGGEAPSNGMEICDPVFRKAYDVVKSGREQVCEVVSQLKQKIHSSRRVTRSQKVIHTI